jgi:ABC-type microcin C transport system permease subunit YejE
MGKMILAKDTKIMNLHVLPNITYATIALIDFDQVGCHLRWHG